MPKTVKPVIYDYHSLETVTDALCRRYNGVITKQIIGKSISGRNISMLKIGSAKETVLYSAAIHGNEGITATILLKFIEDICESISKRQELSGIDIKNMLKSRSYIFVPLSNPDGCEIALKGESAKVENIDRIKSQCSGNFSLWKANANGVDLNRNFNADWETARKISAKNGISSSAPAKYGGPFPESEPETVALTTLCRVSSPQYVICLHTQGEAIFYGGSRYNDSYRKMAEILSLLSGYALEEPENISKGAGFKDWFVKQFDRPGFTIECGRGENPLPADMIQPIYTRLFETLAVSAVL